VWRLDRPYLSFETCVPWEEVTGNCAVIRANDGMMVIRDPTKCHLCLAGGLFPLEEPRKTPNLTMSDTGLIVSTVDIEAHDDMCLGLGHQEIDGHREND
jgi:hypothetical protein